ncbi:MAG: hypothetical protein AB1390_02530 [Nitrospirota bacterium]
MMALRIIGMELAMNFSGFKNRFMKEILAGGEMKSKHVLLLCAFCMFFGIAFWSCGGNGPGSPGSEGTEDTGILIDATILPTYLGSNTYSVDVFQQVCDPGPPPDFEDFTDHNATLTLTARLVNPDATFQPGNLYVEKYTVEYRRSTDSIGSPPIQSDTRFKTIVIPAPVGTGETGVTDTVILVDLLRKDQYRLDITSGQYDPGLASINNYTALYTFEGKNEFGDKFEFKAQTDFQIGSFDYCE